MIQYLDRGRSSLPVLMFEIMDLTIPTVFFLLFPLLFLFKLFFLKVSGKLGSSLGIDLVSGSQLVDGNGGGIGKVLGDFDTF